LVRKSVHKGQNEQYFPISTSLPINIGVMEKYQRAREKEINERNVDRLNAAPEVAMGRGGEVYK